MNLFFQKESHTPNETYVELVDSPKNLQQIIESIKNYAVNGNRLLIDAQAFDEIELVEAILNACGFVEKHFINAIVDCLSQTRSDYHELKEDCDRYKSLIDDYKSTINELIEKIKTLEAKVTNKQKSINTFLTASQEAFRSECERILKESLEEKRMNNLKELKFINKKCTICGRLYQELNIDGVNQRGLCYKCMKSFLKQRRVIHER